MKRIISTFVVIAAALLIYGAPTIAEEGMGSSVDKQTLEATQKDECLLISKDCGDRVDSIVERISHLQREIGRGSNVYSPGELNTLRDKLEEVNKTLDQMLNSSGG